MSWKSSILVKVNGLCRRTYCDMTERTVKAIGFHYHICICAGSKADHFILSGVVGRSNVSICTGSRMLPLNVSLYV